MKIQISNEANLPTRFGDFKIRALKEITQESPLEH